MANFFQTYRLQENGFNIFVIISFIIYLSTALGIAIISPTYIDTLDYWVRFYIALFLLIRFNPFVGKIHFTDLDRKIAFNAGLFLLTTIQQLRQADDVGHSHRGERSGNGPGMIQ